VLQVIITQPITPVGVPLAQYDPKKQKDRHAGLSEKKKAREEKADVCCKHPKKMTGVQFV